MELRLSFAMKVTLGLFILSVFLPACYSLECIECVSTGLQIPCIEKKICASTADRCLTFEEEKKIGDSTVIRVTKQCSTKKDCDLLKERIGKTGEDKYVLLSVDCSKAPTAAASFFLTLSGLLLMKFIL